MKSSIILTIATQVAPAGASHAGASQNYDLYSMCVFDVVHSLLILFSMF